MLRWHLRSHKKTGFQVVNLCGKDEAVCQRKVDSASTGACPDRKRWNEKRQCQEGHAGRPLLSMAVWEFLEQGGRCKHRSMTW
eukprot:1159868-Pelagomonas_calceolata.AAC.7